MTLVGCVTVPELALRSTLHVPVSDTPEAVSTSAPMAASAVESTSDGLLPTVATGTRAPDDAPLTVTTAKMVSPVRETLRGPV